jgi:hypothetical protein
MNLGLLDRQFSVVAAGPTSVSATCPATLATMSGECLFCACSCRWLRDWGTVGHGRFRSESSLRPKVRSCGEAVVQSNDDLAGYKLESALSKTRRQGPATGVGTPKSCPILTLTVTSFQSHDSLGLSSSARRTVHCTSFGFFKAATKTLSCCMQFFRSMYGVAAGLRMTPLTTDLELIRPGPEVDHPWVNITHWILAHCLRHPARRQTRGSSCCVFALEVRKGLRYRRRQSRPC